MSYKFYGVRNGTEYATKLAIKFLKFLILCFIWLSTISFINIHLFDSITD